MEKTKTTLPKKSLALHLFEKLIPVQILSSITVSLCALISTFLISRTLGQSGLAQVEVIDAITNIVVIFGMIMTSGEVLLISRAVCKNEKEVCDRFFSTAIGCTVLFSGILCFVCLAFAKPLCTFFGADATMLPACVRALQGSIIYFATLPFCSVFLSLLQIRSDLKTPIAVSILVFVLNVLLTYVFLAVLKLDIFYAAQARSIAQVVALILLLIRHRQTKFASFSFRKISFVSSTHLFGVGLTESAAHLWSIVKSSFMIKLLASIGGGAALTCFSVISSVDAVTFGLFASAFQLVTLMIAGIYVNEGDRDSLCRFAKTSILLAAGVAAVLGVIVFFSAYPAALLYGVEDREGLMKAQHIFAFAFLFYLPSNTLVSIYAALGKEKVVNVLAFFTALIVPMSAMLVLGRLFGIIGFWHGLLLGDILSLAVRFLYSVIHNKHLPRSMAELLCLDENFGVQMQDTFSLKIRNIEEATGASEKIIDFCHSKGIDRRTAYFSGLCLEEIAVNIVTHGFRHLEKDGIVELSLVNYPDKVQLIVRDNCKQFDPVKKLAVYDAEDKTKGIGIRIVTKTAAMNYKNMYGLNILTMALQKTN